MTASGGQFFSTQKMHISECACKTCLKKLGILLKCRETFEKFLAACEFFLTKTKKCLLTDFYEFKTTRWLANIWQAIPHFPKK